MSKRLGLPFAFLLATDKALNMLMNSLAFRTPYEAPAKIAYLVECCLDADPSQRPAIDRVISILGGKR